MCPIELSDKQASRLIEMCNKLFPESKRTINSNEWEFGSTDDGQIDFLIYEKDKNTICIHWFEFCIMHLSYEIDSFKTESELICGGQSYEKAIWAKHPVDYLYEQFKQLKIK